MRTFALTALLLAACASGPRGVAPDHERAVYENVTVTQVRQAALQVVSDIYEFMDPARVTDDGRVVAESDIGDWKTFEVRFVELEGAVAAEVAVHSISCRTRTASPSRPGRGQPGAVPVALEGGRVEYVSRAVAIGPNVHQRSPDCWTGSREGTQHRILDEIRAVLEAEEPTLD